MQTIEGYVVHSRVNAPMSRWRAGALIAASAVAVAGAGVSYLAWSHIERAPLPPKLEARVSPAPPTGAETDLAAFQQAIALSHLAHVDPLRVVDPVPTATPKPAPALARKVPPPAPPAPLPPSRPVVVVAALPEAPPAPEVERPRDTGFPIIGGLIRQVGNLPAQARGLASGAGDRFFTAVSFVREKAGF